MEAEGQSELLILEIMMVTPAPRLLLLDHFKKMEKCLEEKVMSAKARPCVGRNI